MADPGDIHATHLTDKDFRVCVSRETDNTLGVAGAIRDIGVVLGFGGRGEGKWDDRHATSTVPGLCAVPL